MPCSGGVDVSLESAQAAVVTFAPVYTYYGVDFAPIGLANMLNTGGAVVSVEVEPDWGHERVPAAVAAALRPGSDAALYEEAFSEGAAAPDAAVPRALPRFNVGVRGRGTLLALCGQEPTLCKVEGYGVPFEWRDGRLEVDVPQVGKHTLQHLTVSFR